MIPAESSATVVPVAGTSATLTSIQYAYASKLVIEAGSAPLPIMSIAEKLPRCEPVLENEITLFGTRVAITETDLPLSVGAAPACRIEVVVLKLPIKSASAAVIEAAIRPRWRRWLVPRFTLEDFSAILDLLQNQWRRGITGPNCELISTIVLR